MSDLYEKAFDRIFPNNLGVCENCLGPRFHSGSEKCLSCRAAPDDPVMVEELAKGCEKEEVVE